MRSTPTGRKQLEAAHQGGFFRPTGCAHLCHRLCLRSETEPDADRTARHLRIHHGAPEHLHYRRYRQRQDLHGLRFGYGSLQASFQDEIHLVAGFAAGFGDGSHREQLQESALEVCQPLIVDSGRIAPFETDGDGTARHSGAASYPAQKVFDDFLLSVPRQRLV